MENVDKVDVLVGCQYGSEAKGLAASVVVQQEDYDWLVSVNSAQAGHTVYGLNDEKIVLRHLPAACVFSDANVWIAPGAIINIDVLLEELDMLEELDYEVKNRLHISCEALVISAEDIEKEKNIKLGEKTGSTVEGVGAALSNRAIRVARLAKNFIALRPYTTNTQPTGRVFLEGSQGFGLSNFSRTYPYCTSRDTTTAAFLSYARISPKLLDKVYGVYRTLPIRVGGNSGPLFGEMKWSDVEDLSGYPQDSLAEYTTVTGRQRRVGVWDKRLAREATRVNGVTHPILTFVNYLDRNAEGVEEYNKLPSEVIIKIAEMAKDVGGFWYALSTNRYGGWILPTGV